MEHSFVSAMSTTIISRNGSAMCFSCCCNNFFKLVSLLQLVLLLLVNPAHQQPGTPVIGGVCSLDTPDVHIGGKQTQFYLRCEPSTDSASGEGVWVVKSRRAGSTASKIPAATIVSQHENVHGEQQQHTKKMAPQKGGISSYVCDLVADAVEHGYCSTSENCLQPVYTDRTAFLQCDPTTRRWVKKHCQSGFNFDFERQACIAHTAKMSHHFRQFPICPTGAPALGPCAPGFCVAPMQCAGALCCAPPAVVPPPPPPVAYGCPGGLPALGPCIGGRCASPGTLCASPSNVCCAQSVPTAIPATVCPDGTQAAGACVNGQCGAGFTCNQGLCCTNSSQTPRCLDGSQSIGACIQGKCGTGYTCTTGNICCPSQLNLCPPGQTSVGQAVNGRCPAGYTNFNGQCCGAQSAQSQISCSVEDSFGRCDNNQQCAEPGYACDVANNWCCPQVIGDAIGPCIQGEGGNRLCPEGYACVGEGEGQCFRLDTGTCAPEEQSGPCAPDGSCPPGYECIEGFCCQTDVGAPVPPTAAAALRFRQRRRRAVAPAATAFLGMVRRSK